MPFGAAPLSFPESSVGLSAGIDGVDHILFRGVVGIHLR